MVGGDPGGSAPGLDEPRGYLVTVGEVDRIHFLDWGDPPLATGPGDADAGLAEALQILLIHGIAATAWAWLPVARRLRSRHHVVAQDLRGHGLSDAPPFGYRPGDLAEDALAVAEGAGMLEPGSRLVVAGHGLGGLVAAWLARRLEDRCAALVLVDGGWESADATGLEPKELLRALEEPPEVLRSMAAWLADRAAFDPPTWDTDQEHAARAAVVELPAGRVVLAARPHVLAGCVEAMYEHRPAEVLTAMPAAIVALAAGGEDSAARLAALQALDRDIRREGRRGIHILHLPDAGHNLMRYRPDAVAAAIETAGATASAYHRGS